MTILKLHNFLKDETCCNENVALLSKGTAAKSCSREPEKIEWEM